MDDVERLAGILHEGQCGNLPSCGRWGNPLSGHRQYYIDQACNIFKALEPEIGRANVLTAVKVILDEVT